MVATVTAGHHAVLYVSGATTAFAAEAMTQSGGHTIFTITDATKSVWDPTYTLTQNWTAGPTGTITVNRLLGRLYSTVDETANEPVTTTGKYLPMAAMLYAKDFSLSIKPRVVDTTAFNLAVPYESKGQVIRDVSGTIGTFFTPDASATFVPAITEYFLNKLDADAVFALKFYMSANYSLLAWVNVDTQALREAIENYEEETISFRGAPDADGRVVSQL